MYIFFNKLKFQNRNKTFNKFMHHHLLYFQQRMTYNTNMTDFCFNLNQPKNTSKSLQTRPLTISRPAMGLTGSFWSGRKPIHRMTPYRGGLDITSTIEPTSRSGSAGIMERELWLLRRLLGCSMDSTFISPC